MNFDFGSLVQRCGTRVVPSSGDINTDVDSILHYVIRQIFKQAVGQKNYLTSITLHNII